MTVLELINIRRRRLIKEIFSYETIISTPLLRIDLTPNHLKYAPLSTLINRYDSGLTCILTDLLKPHFLTWLKLQRWEGDIRQGFEIGAQWRLITHNQRFDNFDHYLNITNPCDYILHLCSWGDIHQVSLDGIDAAWRNEIVRFVQSTLKF